MKRGKKMILLLGVLVLLLGGYAAIGSMNNQETGTVSETEGTFLLWNEGEAITALSWENNGEQFAFEMGENVWLRTGDETFPVNQSALESLAGKITNLTATRELTDVSSMGDYGLDTPVFTVSAKNANGDEITFAMGDATPFADGYYLSVTGKDAVYVISTSLATSFDKTITQLATMESMPEVTSVTRLTVGDTLDVTWNEDLQLWCDTATGEELDSDAVSDLVSVAMNLTWSELVSTGATDEKLSTWGLDDGQATAVTLYNGETAERTVLLGGKDDETDRYARLPGSRMVYTFYSDDADELLEASLDTLWQKQPVTMTTDALGEARFAWDGGEKTLTAQDSESTAAQSVLEQLSSLKGTARVAIEETGDVILTVQLTDSEGGEETLTFYAYNVDSYLLPITDAYGMLVPAQDVDKLIRMLKQAG